MIKSFNHKGLEKFFQTGNTSGIQTVHKDKLTRILFALNEAEYIEDLFLPGFKTHKLKGNMQNLYSITVRANWRITFEFKDKNAYIVDYRDYH